MSKTPNGLLLGIIDNKTSKGYISLLSESGQFHQTSLGDAKIFSYTSSQLGMLAQGVLYDDATQTCAPQTTLIGVNGEIVFQKLERLMKLLWIEEPSLRPYVMLQII